jgi:hypothetical protein
VPSEDEPLALHAIRIPADAMHPARLESPSKDPKFGERVGD